MDAEAANDKEGDDSGGSVEEAVEQTVQRSSHAGDGLCAHPEASKVEMIEDDNHRTDKTNAVEAFDPAVLSRDANIYVVCYLVNGVCQNISVWRMPSRYVPPSFIVPDAGINGS